MKDNELEQSRLLISVLTFRKAVGILGISLPFLLLAGTSVGGCTQIQESISHYYYTVMGPVFVGILSAVGFFLFLYKGYENIDNISTTLAGIFSLGVALFPCSKNLDTCCALFDLCENDLRVIIHFTSAALFFVTSAYISFFLFTRSKKGEKMSSEKNCRNRIYRICGIVIIIAIALVPINYISGCVSVDYKPTFVLETIALNSFGISWIIKGETFFKDEEVKLYDENNTTSTLIN